MTPHDAMVAWGAAAAAALEAWAPFHAAEEAHAAAAKDYYAAACARARDAAGAVPAAKQAMRATFPVYDAARLVAAAARERAVESYVAAGLFASASALQQLFPRTLDGYSPDLEDALDALLLAPVRP